MAKVLLFGWFADNAGWAEREIAASDLAGLRELIDRQYPDIGAALAAGKGRNAVNQVIVDGNVSLDKGDEVAFFPPFSGG